MRLSKSDGRRRPGERYNVYRIFKQSTSHECRAHNPGTPRTRTHFQAQCRSGIVAQLVVSVGKHETKSQARVERANLLRRNVANKETGKTCAKWICNDPGSGHTKGAHSDGYEDPWTS